MPKAEISWKRVTEDGVKLQVYAQKVSGDWRFFDRQRRFDCWRPVPNPPLEDWLELLDAVRRLVNRRRLKPIDEERVSRRIRERFPEVQIPEKEGY